MRLAVPVPGVAFSTMLTVCLVAYPGRYPNLATTTYLLKPAAVGTWRGMELKFEHFDVECNYDDLVILEEQGDGSLVRAPAARRLAALDSVHARSNNLLSRVVVSVRLNCGEAAALAQASCLPWTPQSLSTCRLWPTKRWR